MLGRRALLRAIAGVGVGTSVVRGKQTTGGTMSIFSTPAFGNGNRIPREFTCEGRDVSPPLEINVERDDVNSLAIVVDDPDAPSGTFTHWLMWDIPPDRDRIPKDVPQMEIISDLGGAKQGENDFGDLGYRGPCPPQGDGPHTYRFSLYLLESQPRLGAGATKDALLDAMGGIRLGRSRFTGEFGRR